MSEERTPLVTPARLPASGGTPSIGREALLLLRYAGPVVATHLLEMSLIFSTVVATGHLGVAELAASALASMSANVVGLSVLIGIAVPCDTLCPMAYTSPYPERTSLYALRSAVLCTGVMVPQMVLFWSAEPILLALGQTPRVAALASQYLRVISFGLPGFAAFEIGRRYLQAQGMMHLPTVVLSVTAPFNIMATWLLVWGPENVRFGFIGAPMATALSWTLSGLVCLIQCLWCTPRCTHWQGPKRAAFHHLGANARLGIAGIVAVGSSWWAWEVMHFVVSQLGPTALAAQSAASALGSLTFQVTFAVASAASVRVGNLFGKADVRTARTTSQAALLLGLSGGVVTGLCVFMLRRVWGRAFTKDREVLELVSQILPLIALFQVSGGVTTLSGGVMRGAGKTALVAGIDATGYWLLGLPLGIALTFSSVDLGIRGVWLGMTISITFAAFVYLWVVLRLDWDEALKAAQRRMHEDTVIPACAI